MSNIIKGTIITIHDPKTFESGFQKQDIEVSVQDGKYTTVYPVSFTKDKVGLLSNLNVGDIVEVGFNIRSNEYKGRYFVNFIGWKIKLTDEQIEADTADVDLF